MVGFEDMATYLNPTSPAPLLPTSQDVLEVNILLIGLIPQAMLTVHLLAGFMELSTHRQIGRITRQTRSLAGIRLLLSHANQDENKEHDNAPENAPDSEDAFEGVDLFMLARFLGIAPAVVGCKTYVLGSEL